MNDDERKADDASQKDDVGFNQGIEEVGDMVLGGGGGALLGSLAGLVVGGPVGALAGAGLGTLAGTAMAASVTSTWNEPWHEPTFREHHESFHPQGEHTWDQAAPAYRYGWEGHDRPEHRGKSWEEARAGLEEGWAGPGPYPEVEPYVKHAWERRASSRPEPGPQGGR